MNQIAFDNSYARLPPRFHTRRAPTPVAAPSLVKLNRDLADVLNLDPAWLAGADGLQMLAGNTIPPGADPIATAYAGHQFGNFVPRLGDGRAVLLGEVVGRDGQRYDIQLKGSGPTPFSRGGDGRAGLGPVLREYLVSEAMAALGIPTTRALAAVTTGERVLRDPPAPGAVLTRIAASHIRVGTFEYLAAQRDTDGLRTLADHVIARHYPDLAAAPNPVRALLEAVAARQADLVARWLLVGFIHGVMNTDNTAMSGETIDYGPCAFMDSYDPAIVFSSIDHAGRYAYANQPNIALWNLTRLAEALLPLLADDPGAAIPIAREALATYPPRFAAAYAAGLRAKLGLHTERDGDAALAQDLLAHMAAEAADFTQTFRRLADLDGADLPPDWHARWRQRLALDHPTEVEAAAALRAANPAFTPRNHLVEAALDAAIARQDYAPFDDLLHVLARPYDDQPAFPAHALPPPSGQRAYRTFCGT